MGLVEHSARVNVLSKLALAQALRSLTRRSPLDSPRTWLSAKKRISNNSGFEEQNGENKKVRRERFATVCADQSREQVSYSKRCKHAERRFKVYRNLAAVVPTLAIRVLMADASIKICCTDE